MSNSFALKFKMDPSKYPSRMGQPWEEDEVVKLLASIQQNKSIEDIASDHERTIGGINAYRKKLAVEYYTNDQRPIKQIQKFTGLSQLEIEDAINRHEIREGKVKAKEQKLPNMSDMMIIIKDIQRKLDMLIERVA
jgi:hypothetical protein